MSATYLDPDYLLAGQKRVRIAVAMALAMQILLLVGLLLRGFEDRIPSALVRLAISGLLCYLMLVQHSRPAHLIFRVLIALSLTFSVPAVYDSATPSDARWVFGIMSVYYLAVFGLISYGKGVGTFFHKRARQDLAQLRAR